MGKAELRVSRAPRVAILSTGDELVPIEATPAPQQIRRSNGYLLQATLAPYVAEATPMHLPDDKALIRERVAEVFETYDVVLLSGGVSMGKADFIPAVMEELGVRRLFHKIRQRPGKPFWFGLWQEQTPVFALPGNPVSTFVGCTRYVLPWLRRHLGQPDAAPRFATLAEDYHFAPPLTYFLQVRVETTRKVSASHDQYRAMARATSPTCSTPTRFWSCRLSGANSRQAKCCRCWRFEASL